MEENNLVIDDISMREIYIGINEDLNTYEEEEKGKIETRCNEHFDLGMAHSLIMIEHFVNRTLVSEEPAFTESKGTRRELLKALPLGEYHFPLLDFYIRQYSPYLTFSEHVELFFSSCIDLGLLHGLPMTNNPYLIHLPSGKRGGEVFNELVDLIRKGAKTERFKNKVIARKNNVVRMYNSIERYINFLFIKSSRLLVLRIDLYYLKQYTRQVTIEEAHRDRKHFLNNMRGNSLFRHLAGYVWKLEYGEEKGYHFHLILFFKGSERRKDEWLAKQISNYWSERIIPGRGWAHTSNCRKNKFKHLGIGMISYGDQEKRNNLLLRVVRYLTKADQFLRVKSKVRSRVFGKGEMPGERSNLAGRPRKEPG